MQTELFSKFQQLFHVSGRDVMESIEHPSRANFDNFLMRARLVDAKEHIAQRKRTAREVWVKSLKTRVPSN